MTPTYRQIYGGIGVGIGVLAVINIFALSNVSIKTLPLLPPGSLEFILGFLDGAGANSGLRRDHTSGSECASSSGLS